MPIIIPLYTGGTHTGGPRVPQGPRGKAPQGGKGGPPLTRSEAQVGGREFPSSGQIRRTNSQVFARPPNVVTGSAAGPKHHLGSRFEALENVIYRD